MDRAIQNLIAASRRRNDLQIALRARENLEVLLELAADTGGFDLLAVSKPGDIDSRLAVDEHQHRTGPVVDEEFPPPRTIVDDISLQPAADANQPADG